MGTTDEFFDRYRYRGGRGLEISSGNRVEDLFHAVIGADVAAKLNYSTGQEIVVAHGLASFTEHDEMPFRVSGILAKTGTPIDRTVFVSLEAIEAIHINWQDGGRIPGQTTSADEVRTMDLQPKSITSALIGVNSKLRIFTLQRWINEYEEEPLLAILPGIALHELWNIVGVAESALIGVSAMIVITALLGMATMIFAGLDERRREMAILRAVGARPSTIVSLLLVEATFMTSAAVIFGAGMLYSGMWMARPYIDDAFGLYLRIGAPTGREWAVLALVIIAGAAVSLAPALRAYRMSLTDGMQVRI